LRHYIAPTHDIGGHICLEKGPSSYNKFCQRLHCTSMNRRYVNRQLKDTKLYPSSTKNYFLRLFQI